jgi:Flp pilus assembly pilin Flp
LSRLAGIDVAKHKSHSKCCRDRQGAITQVSWDDACILCAILPGSLQRSGANINLQGDKSMQKIKNFINDESGMETLEYAMIAGLIAIVAIAVYGSGSTWGTNLFNRLIAATNAS